MAFNTQRRVRPILDIFLMMHLKLLYEQPFCENFVYKFHSLKSAKEEPRKNFAQFYEKS